MLAPIEPEPAHVALDGLDIFLRFLRRIGIIEPKMAAPPEFLGQAEIEAYGFRVPDVKIAVRFRRKARDHLFDAASLEIGPDDVADEIVSRVARGRPAACRFRARHASSRGTIAALWKGPYAMTGRPAQCQSC